MSIDKDRSDLIMENSVAIIYVSKISNLLSNIKDSVENNQIKALVVVFDSDELNTDEIFNSQELDKYLLSLPILSVALLKNKINFSTLELAIKFNIRLASDDARVNLIDDVSKYESDLKDEMDLLIGKEKYISNYSSLMEQSANIVRLYNIGLINRIISSKEIGKEIENYLTKLLGSRDINQINSIITCFNTYRHYGLNCDRQVLLQEEAKQFCALVARVCKLRS